MPDLTRKRRPEGAADAEPAGEARVQRDLLARGVASALARPLAARIAPRAARLSDEDYTLFLDGVAAAHGGEDAHASESGAVELQRLMQDFAAELKKLDEGLRLLSAYLLRIRDRTRREPSRTLH